MVKWNLTFRDPIQENAYWLKRWNETYKFKSIILWGVIAHNLMSTLEIALITQITDWVIITATSLQWVFAVGALVLFYLGPCIPPRKVLLYLWWIDLTLLTIVSSFFIEFKTVLCHYGLTDLQCNPLPNVRPRLRFRYYYNVMGFAVGLMLDNSRAWQWSGALVTIVVFMYATFVSNSPLLTDFFDIFLITSAIFLFFYLSFVNEKIWREKFVLTESLKKEVERTTALANRLTTEIEEKQKAYDLLREETDKRFHFMSYIFHEIRVPLNALMLTLTYMENDADFTSKLNNEERQQIASVLPNLAVIEGILTDSLDYEKLTKGFFQLRPAPFDFNTMLRSVVVSSENMWNFRDQQFTLELDDKLSSLPNLLLGDEMRLRQIITNYLSNASKYTPIGGAISLRDRLESISDGTAVVYLEVEDNGIGIADEDKSKIFRPFVNIIKASNEMQKGTGLGLSISAELTKLMNGEYGFESQVGVGSKFWIKVPFKESSIPATNASEPQSDQRGQATRRLSILLVDDDKLTLSIMSKVLRKQGHTVDTVTDGDKALVKLSRRPSAYNLVIIDELMPGLQGHEVIELCRKKGIDLPFISLTGDTTTETKDQLLKAGAIDVLYKPVSSSLLQKTLGIIPVKTASA